MVRLLLCAPPCKQPWERAWRARRRGGAGPVARRPFPDRTPPGCQSHSSVCIANEEARRGNNNLQKLCATPVFFIFFPSPMRNPCLPFGISFYEMFHLGSPPSERVRSSEANTFAATEESTASCLDPSCCHFFNTLMLHVSVLDFVVGEGSPPAGGKGLQNTNEKSRRRLRRVFTLS